jgi:hypothetical protein
MHFSQTLYDRVRDRIFGVLIGAIFIGFAVVLPILSKGGGLIIASISVLAGTFGGFALIASMTVKYGVLRKYILLGTNHYGLIPVSIVASILAHLVIRLFSLGREK